jgi:glyoxylase-like metal-dependent hydrolase (beta-lactamase superfamily II)
MPLPFRLDHINLYLLEDRDGWTVVDAGIGLDRTRELWRGVLDAELDGKPITPRARHALPSGSHRQRRLARAALRGRALVPAGRVADGSARLAGQATSTSASPTTAQRRDDASSECCAAPASLRTGRAVGGAGLHGVRDGDVIAIGEGAWEALTVFGHSPEQAILYSREAGVLISGDQVLPKITTNVSVWPDQPLGNPLRLYLDSLGRFREMPDETLVLPHGLPFRGLQTRLARLHHHHDEQLARSLEALAEPQTGEGPAHAVHSRPRPPSVQLCLQ